MFVKIILGLLLVSTLNAQGYGQNPYGQRNNGQDSYGQSNFGQGVSEFLPSDLTNLELWLRPDDLSAGTLTTWPDDGPNAHTITQATASQRPTVVANQLNGHAVVRFDGTDDYLEGGDILDLRTNSKSIIVVGLANTTGDEPFVSKTLFASVSGRYSLTYFATSTLYSLFQNNAGNQIAQGSDTPGSYALYTAIIDRGTGNNDVYRDGSLVDNHSFTPESVDLNTSFRFLIGGYNNAGDTGEQFTLDGDIAEVVVYDRALSASEQQQIENYLNTKYNIF